MSSKGWIYLYRQIKDHWVWQDKPFSKGQAWIDLIILANHEDVTRMYNGSLITFKMGTVNHSMLSLADRWGWDRRKVTRFLKCLEDDGMVSVNSTTHGTTIALVNYGDFQFKCTTDSTTECTTNVQPHVQPMYINNKLNNDNNENNINIGGTSVKSKAFKPPVFDEVKAYCDERNNGIDPQQFIDFYASKNWMIGKNKMKDWKAAIRTWERRRKDEPVGMIKPLKKVSNFNNFQQRNYDFAELEKKLFNR